MTPKCIACEEFGRVTYWKAGVDAILCERHAVELSQLIADMPEFRAFSEAGLSYTEYLASLTGGAARNAAPAQQMTAAQDGLRIVIRRQLDKWETDWIQLRVQLRIERDEAAEREARKDN